jgi:hypothetical protein
VVLPAGQVTPSPKTYDPNGRPENVIQESEWTEDMQRVARFSKELHFKLTRTMLSHVRIVREPHVGWAANYGHGMCLNYSKLGKAWFAQPNRAEKILDLLVHEFGHFYGDDHLSEQYHDGLTLLAARLANVCLNEPDFFA